MADSHQRARIRRRQHFWHKQEQSLHVISHPAVRQSIGRKGKCLHSHRARLRKSQACAAASASLDGILSAPNEIKIKITSLETVTYIVHASSDGTARAGIPCVVQRRICRPILSIDNIQQTLRRSHNHLCPTQRRMSSDRLIETRQAR